MAEPDPTEAALIAVLVPSRDDLIEALMTALPLGQPIIGDVLTIHMDPCDQTISFAHVNDIPECDVPCSCGNNRHWFVRYTGR